MVSLLRAVRRVPARKARGFSLVEVSVAAVAIAVVSAIGFNALTGIRQRSTYSNTTNAVLSALRQARNGALGSSVPHHVVFHTGLGRWWVIADRGAALDFSTFDPAQPTPENPGVDDDRLIGQGTIEEPATIGPSAGFGGALPRPWAAVPASSACTFCDGTNGLGVVTFHQNGTATLSGANPDAGSITFSRGGFEALRTYAIVGRTGAVEVFEK